jgi:hypothetical protein
MYAITDGLWTYTNVIQNLENCSRRDPFTSVNCTIDPVSFATRTGLADLHDKMAELINTVCSSNCRNKFQFHLL